ncbi:MAG: hypothetical protein ABSB76_06615 [Streptosporangiaceae bacterium]
MAAATTAVQAPASAGTARPRRDRAVTMAALYYLLAALAVTLWLWRDPASRTVAGNANDADQFAWFFRYDATAVMHLRLPALVTTAMNAPQGVNAMWNTFMLLPGVLLAPVTALLGPQTALTVFMTAGFAGSATAMFAVLRRWGVSPASAALGGAVYGFSPAVLHSAIGHYDLQFAVLPPLIIDVTLRLVLGRVTPVRGGLWLGLLVTAQLLITEEILLGTAVAGVILLLVLAASRPRAVAAVPVRQVAAGLGLAACVTGVLAGYPLWVQFFGPLHQHGSPFTPDFFKNDLSSFVVPSSYLLFHTAGSAAAALSYQGHLPEYLGYLGWPLLAVLTLAMIGCWRRLPVRAAAVTCGVLGLFSLGGTLLFAGHEHPAIKLPWYWLQGLPLLTAALPDRFSLLADGAAAAVLALAADAAIAALAALATRRGWPRLASGWRPAAVVMSCAVLAVLPIVPRPLPAAAANPPPPGWSATFAALRLPASASVLVVPLPMSTFTEPLRWQADTGEPSALVGGYFMGPATGGRGYIDGDGTPPAGLYLNAMWLKSAQDLPAALASAVPGRGAPASESFTSVRAVTDASMRAQLAAWRVTAVVAVATRNSLLGRYLTALLGPPTAAAGDVLAWRR